MSNQIVVRARQIVEHYPCKYRLWIKLQSAECYCSFYDKFIKLRWCVDCPHRKVI